MLLIDRLVSGVRKENGEKVVDFYFVVNIIITSGAFEGYRFAKEHGKGNEYHHKVFTPIFQGEQNIEDIEVLTNIAGEVGLSKDTFKEALVSRKYREAHQEALKHAYEEAKIMSVPTFVIGEEVIQGLASKEKLAQVLIRRWKKTKQMILMECSVISMGIANL